MILHIEYWEWDDQVLSEYLEYTGTELNEQQVERWIEELWREYASRYDRYISPNEKFLDTIVAEHPDLLRWTKSPCVEIYL